MPPRVDFRSQRLFVEQPLEAGVDVPLDRARANYLINVLRMGPGDRLLIFNGRDGEWRAELTATGKRDAALRALELTRPQPEPGRIILAFAPLKQARLDYLVQKAVEMGVATIQPIITHRTQVQRLNADRLNANIIEAAEQCGVLALPTLADEMRFDRWLAALEPAVRIVFCDEDAEIADPTVALRALPRGSPLAVTIGPEGGFDPDERQALLARPGTVRIALGPRILRADTAAVASLAIIQAAVGDWA